MVLARDSVETPLESVPNESLDLGVAELTEVMVFERLTFTFKGTGGGG